MEAGPSVSVDDLPTVLDPDGAWTDAYSDRPEYPVPTVTGAYRVEVVGATPENDEFFAGAVWRQTNRWGAAAVVPVDVRGPVRKDEATNCDGNEQPLGTTAYFLSTDSDIPVRVAVVGDDPRVSTALDDLFGPSERTPDEEIGSATIPPRSRTTVVPADRETRHGLRVIFRRFSFVAVAGVLALVRLGFGRLFRRR